MIPPGSWKIEGRNHNCFGSITKEKMDAVMKIPK
jgi:hypothetical protein